MQNTTNEYKWQDLEIFGFIIRDFAAHIHMVFNPLMIFHLFCLWAAALSLIYLLVKLLKNHKSLKQDKGFSRIFTFVLTPSLILMVFSGGYLYFIMSVLYGAGFAGMIKLFIYGLFIACTLISSTFIIRNIEGDTVSKIKIYTLIAGIFISSALIFLTSLGEFL